MYTGRKSIESVFYRVKQCEISHDSHTKVLCHIYILAAFSRQSGMSTKNLNFVQPSSSRVCTLLFCSTCHCTYVLLNWGKMTWVSVYFSIVRIVSVKILVCGGVLHPPLGIYYLWVQWGVWRCFWGLSKLTLSEGSPNNNTGPPFTSLFMVTQSVSACCKSCQHFSVIQFCWQASIF